MWPRPDGALARAIAPQLDRPVGRAGDDPAVGRRRRADDIVLDHEFAPVMTLRDGGGARLDWSAFHTLLPVAEENARHVIGSSHS